MPKRLHIRGAQIVTMDESLGDFASADILVEDGADPRRRAGARRGGCRDGSTAPA